MYRNFRFFSKNVRFFCGDIFFAVKTGKATIIRRLNWTGPRTRTEGCARPTKNAAGSELERRWGWPMSDFMDRMPLVQ